MAACRRPDPRALGRSYTEWLYRGEDERLLGRFQAKLREHFVAGGLARYRGQVQAVLGDEAEVLAEEVVAKEGGGSTYVRTARFTRLEGPVRVEWRLDEEGLVKMFRVLPTAWTEARSRTALRLPFATPFRVTEGGRSLGDNYHPWFPEALFAYDFTPPDGSCLGAPVLAPAAGRVEIVEDQARDNPIGQREPTHPLGNRVVIDHGNGEHSHLLHLQHGSITVRVGDQVAAGQPVGRCGNSGNSKRPHLHYHLTDERGVGRPAAFRAYLADGAAVPSGEPRRGQIVAPEAPR